MENREQWVMMVATSVNNGDWVSYSTEKGRYVGKVESVRTTGRIGVVSGSGGVETIDVSSDNPVAIVRIYVNNEDGTYTRSDRTAPVRVAMLRIISEPETKDVSASVRKTLSEKAKDHNEKVKNAKTKKTTTRTLVAVFERGVGAYQTNPQSVRPTVSSAEQWAFARVNSFLYALRNGRFRGGKHDTDLLPKGHPQSSKSLEVKGPKCRQSDETYDECVSRKIGELIEEDGMERDQAIAVANSMCEKSCDEVEYDSSPPLGGEEFESGVDIEANNTIATGSDVEKATNFPSRGDDQKVSIANSQWKVFPRGEAEKLRTEWPEIWRKGGNILGNTQYRRLTKVMEQGGSPKTPTDEKAIRLREAWVARHFKDFRLAGVVAQIKWLAVGSRGLSFMRKVISDEKKRLRERDRK